MFGGGGQGILQMGASRAVAPLLGDEISVRELPDAPITLHKR